MLRRQIYILLAPLINRKVVKKNKFLKLLRKVFGFIFIPNKIRVENFLMHTHKSGHSFELAFEGGYELLETGFLKDMDVKNKIVIDAGACIGYYTLLLSGLVGCGGKVLAFEPEKKNFDLLQKNIVANNAANVSISQLAVGDKNKTVYLRKGESPGQHIIIENVVSRASPLSMVKLDDHLKINGLSYKDVAYVKIDVEGCEFKVLQGMRGIIEKSKKLIVQFEFAPQHLEEQNCNFEELILFIKNHNLKIYYWDFKIKKLIQCKNLDWFLQKDVIEDFKKGILYSRNILLSKLEICSNYVVKELIIVENNGAVEPESVFIKPFPYLDLKISKNTKIELPRSGKYFIGSLKNLDFIDKNVLDIGTGYFGFLARHAKFFGARRVVAVDLNQSAIKHVSQNTESGIDYRFGDVYSSIKSDEKFDIIISNPPQLPSVFGGNIHDVAGDDGMEVIKKIIVGFRRHTNKDGKMYLLLFDFLFDKTFQVCRKNGLDITVVAYYNKYLRKNGETEKRRGVIESMFQGYRFQKNKEGLSHSVYILEIKAYEHNT